MVERIGFPTIMKMLESSLDKGQRLLVGSISNLESNIMTLIEY